MGGGWMCEQDLVRRIDSLGQVSGASYEELSAIADDFAQQILLAKAAADRCKDAEKRNKLLTAIKKAEEQLQQLRTLTAQLLRTPNDPALHQAIEQLLADIKKASKALAAAVASPPEDKLVANGTSLQADLEAVTRAINSGNGAAVSGLIPSIERRIDLQVATAKLAHRNTEHPEVQEILVAEAKRLETTKPALLASLRTVAAAPTDATKKSEALKHVKTAQQANAALVDAGKRVAAKEQPRARADMSKVTSVAGAAAAIDAALVGRSAYDDSTPKGRIMNASKRIGIEMAKLAQAAQRGDKKEIIRATNAISDMSVEIGKHTEEMCRTCRDPKIIDQLRSSAHATRNFGIQLKILSAVKTASEGVDSTTEGQLVTCGKGLASAVIDLIDTAEVGDLKRTFA